MSEVQLLERIEEALAEPPPGPVVFSRQDDFEDFKERAIALVEKSKDRLDAMRLNVAKARQHEGHASLFPDFWPALATHLTNAIQSREAMIKQSRPKVTDSAKIRSLKLMIQAQLTEEHNTFVEIFYLLKGDADSSAPDTRGTGERLSAASDVDSLFDRIPPKE